MKRVEKYPLKPGSVASMFNLKLPKGAKAIMVGSSPEDGEEHIWVEFPASNSDNLVEHVFEIFGDGHLIPPLSTHVISFKSGPFMWHLYDHGEVLKPLGAR